MREFLLQPVRDAPFSHVLVDGWLNPTTYAELASEFPECPRESGPTGFTLFRGDAAYARLMATSPAWASLIRSFNSPAYVDYAVRQFRDIFAHEATIDLSCPQYVDYEESRRDKERRALARIEHSPEELWVRVDIMQGRVGYGREPHLDHRRRATSMLLYFCDADENGMVGGELILHGAKEDGAVVRPRHNRMVIFPCYQHSLHSVAAIVRQSKPRNFVQVTVSSSVDLWQMPPRSRWARILKRLRS